MCTNWKRFTLKAIMLASLSLFLYGCAATVTEEEAPVLTKEIRGVVSDIATGQSFANAEVKAYAIDANGNVSATPLSIPVHSDGQGNFVLNIPQSYIGGIKLVAIENGSIVRAVLPSATQTQPVSISLGTEMVAQYVESRTGLYTANNIQQAVLVLEPFLGQNFTQTTPAAIGATPTQAQQQQLVMTQAIDNLLTTGGYTITSLVTVNNSTSTIALGEGAAFTNLKSEITAVSTDLISAGAVSGSYNTTPTIIPVPEPVLTDKTAPSAPQAFSATATTTSVTLSWSAAAVADGVTVYYIYRNDVFLATASASSATYTDPADPATTYTYVIKARDAAGNVSAGSTVTVTTAPILSYTISGKIAGSNGVGLASVYVAISGAGSGVFVTDSQGNYSIPSVRQGNYSITPSLSGYTFAPVSRSIVVSDKDVTNQDFTATVIDTGSITGGVTYPPGTIIGGISYPSGVVIGGVTYPTATVVGGVVYPTGTVIGGVTYPNGVIIGGVSYPAGTIVGGVAFPVGAVTTGVTYPTGTVIGGVTYPSGAVVGNVTYPAGTIIGAVTYPSSAVIGNVTYPAGSVTALLSWNQWNRISGQVTFNGAALSGVLVAITKDGLDYTVTTTDSYGNYSIPVPLGTYTITPSLTGYSFTPAVISAVTISTEGTIVSGQNFTATSP